MFALQADSWVRRQVRAQIGNEDSVLTLIASTSGIRGIVGGTMHMGLTPIDVASYTAAYAQFLLHHTGKQRHVLVGRDARPSGGVLSQIVQATFQSMGIEVWDIGLTTTPTIEMEVVRTGAMGGVMLTGSHNPQGWNALKFLNKEGLFISQETHAFIVRAAAEKKFVFAQESSLGCSLPKENGIDQHIRAITQLALVKRSAIAKRAFKVGIDAVCSTGGLAIPRLLEALGVREVHPYFCEPTGIFPHNPEPLPPHITHLSRAVQEKELDLGIVVDPDVDRLVLICETGEPFGEEYTLVAVADYVLRHQPGNTVSNLSSSCALKVLTEQHGGTHYFSAVGEPNVVAKMKAHNAVIGGEGNGGVIYPALHYGRDALVGIALFLSHLATAGESISALRERYPRHVMKKEKLPMRPLPPTLLNNLAANYVARMPSVEICRDDGLRLTFTKDSWLHIRRSNTEPIIRLHAEAPTVQSCDALIAEARALIDTM